MAWTNIAFCESVRKEKSVIFVSNSIIQMKLANAIEKAFKAVLPSPFSIAIILTIITIGLAFFFTPAPNGSLNHFFDILHDWQTGLWNEKLLVFAFQMMLMLVLGHALALTSAANRVINAATSLCTSTAKAAAIVTFLTIIISLFNWGLGLIFGAILARKVGEAARKMGRELNYALIGAAGYSGLMVWHGGISGSAPVKAAEPGHIHSLMSGVIPDSELANIASSVSYSDTIFGTMNIVTMVLLLIILPGFMYFVGRRTKKKSALPEPLVVESSEESISGAEQLDYSRVMSLVLGGLLTAYAVMLAVKGYTASGWNFINPNFLNLLLLGMCLVLHKNIRSFLKGVEHGISGAAGILIQFPLYFGIMGIMKESGLVQIFSDFFVSISSETSFPIYSFLSAGIVNVFVPSGGGQWGVQGPILIQAANELGAGLPKTIMALSYGDQLTNMLQPFWALPLLGITGLKAKEILPYTVALMGVGILIFVSVLLIF